MYELAEFEPCIGLEIHCQLLSDTKLFCSCPNKFGSVANENCCPVCLGYPGTLPSPNLSAVKLALQFGASVEGKLDSELIFARKHYFYPDLPKGYQITQHDRPFCLGGRVQIENDRWLNLHHVHMEEDAGKLIHEGAWSYIDLNRAGLPLIEIVTMPELHSASDAASVIKNLRKLVRFLKISDGNMEEGSIRCDVNVSLRRKGADTLGTKCEIKNLNSTKSVERAIEYEIERQSEILESGSIVRQCTLSFDDALGVTQVMRMKEDAQDYRYLQEPDLPNFKLSNLLLELKNTNRSDLPWNLKSRFVDEYEISDSDAEVLTSEPEVAQYFVDVIESSFEENRKLIARMASNWIQSELMREVKESSWADLAKQLPPQNLFSLLSEICNGRISGSIAKTVLKQAIKSGDSPAKIISTQGLLQVQDESEVVRLIDHVLQTSPAELEGYLQGKEKLFQFFIGSVMKAGKGKLNPKLVNDLLRKRLTEIMAK
jgi:aspartyl-tRNA(Asn)/glutamyl-tRNA(Gln) amidotransferase subunit B